ncbi:MAG: hypothetical protein GX458_00980, partial [Phyllobacteriaceae bacterium]|nr:hypothetical protein [Phyllobacteriaceae bacterium]
MGHRSTFRRRFERGGRRGVPIRRIESRPIDTRPSLAPRRQRRNEDLPAGERPATIRLAPTAAGGGGRSSTGPRSTSDASNPQRIAKVTKSKVKIAVAGAGYVGLSLSLLLSRAAEVVLLDIDRERLAKIAAGVSPLQDKEIEAVLADPARRPTTTADPAVAYDGADFVVVATPTNYAPDLNYFDTSTVESVIRDVTAWAPEATIVIKSTIPVGFTERMRREHATTNILFSPEFLR